MENGTEFGNLLDKEFKLLIIKMLPRLERGVEEISENLYKETESIKQNQSEMKNTINEIKNTLQGINSRLESEEEWISDMEE